jgi:uncharacterized protein YbjT (DUF2867 family)
MAGRKAMVAGATGLGGRAIVEGLLADRTVAEVIASGGASPTSRTPS